MKRLWICLPLLMACNGSGSGSSASGTDSGGTDGDTIGPDSPFVDPETCSECHPNHYQQWLGSMHAYAADDPVFLAMNARGQRETNGELGEFCIKCHAPLAVELGLTQDGLNLDEIPQKLKGVTCYYCHNVVEVEGTHNNPLRLALDKVMRGNITDPAKSELHEAAYDPHLDGRTLRSGDMCGSCHDIVNPNGVHLERTYEEWLYSFYSNPDPMQPQLPDQTFFGQTCANCHMDGTENVAIADAPGVPADRTYHDHRFVGVDVALTPFPDAQQAPALEADQRAGIEEMRASALCGSLCVRPGQGGGDEIAVWLHNEFAGHNWPSGALQDRRAWVEVIAYDANDQVLFETGVVPDGTPMVSVEDPNLWSFWERMLDGQGQEVHMFWEAMSVEGSSLPVADSFFGDPNTWTRNIYPELTEDVARVTLRVRLRPMGLEVLDDLIDSGDLDPAIRDKMETFDVAPVTLTWIPPDPNNADAAQVTDNYGSCVSSSPTCFSPFLRCAKLTNAEGCEETDTCSCDKEPNCTWTPPETDTMLGWCHGCGVWTDEQSCLDGDYCIWDGSACTFSKCADATEGTCGTLTGCTWSGTECVPA